MDLSKYKGKGMTGLVNLGNTCFLNSCLQVLNHTYELNHLLETKYEKHLKGKESVIFKEWTDLRNVMWTNNGTISPNRFVYNVQQLAIAKDKDIFTGWAQNDMSEFLSFIVDCLHAGISRSINVKINGNIENETDILATNCYQMLKSAYTNDYSEIMAMFYAIQVYEIASLDGTVQSVKPEMFFILDLPITSNTLMGCLDSYTHPELLEGENAWYNERTGKKEDIHKRITFWSFPDVLVITLQRFAPDGSRKKTNHIDFPLSLDLSKYVDGYNPSQYKYDLYGICNHMGGTHNGHYTAFVKNSENVWIHYNDTDVEIIEQIITPNAYCLFYRKKIT